MRKRQNLLAMAHDLLEAQCLRQASAEPDPASPTAVLQRPLRAIEPTMIDWLLPDLVRMVEQDHHQPANVHEPVIRRKLLEQSFINEAGDNFFGRDIQDGVDQIVEMLVDLLEEIRLQAINQERLSHAPLAPQMFG